MCALEKWTADFLPENPWASHVVEKLWALWMAENPWTWNVVERRQLVSLLARPVSGFSVEKSGCDFAAAAAVSCCFESKVKWEFVFSAVKLHADFWAVKIPSPMEKPLAFFDTSLKLRRLFFAVVKQAQSWTAEWLAAEKKQIQSARSTPFLHSFGAEFLVVVGSSVFASVRQPRLHWVDRRAKQTTIPMGKSMTGRRYYYALWE